MGTRSLTSFIDSDGKEIAVLYRQFDGYLEGHGNDLAQILSGKRIVNGFGTDNELRGDFNGMSDLACQTIAYLKVREGTNGRKWDKQEKRPLRPIISTGNFYLYPAGTRNCGEEYHYYITQNAHSAHIKACTTNWEDGADLETVFDGTPQELLAKVEQINAKVKA